MPRPAPTPVAKGYFVTQYHSSLDHSDQPFALWVPLSYSRRKAYPLIVALHGTEASETMIPQDCFKMHERGFREDVILLSPFGRGDLWYRWMGEVDFWDTINWVKSHYRINPRRQYLTGLSMGGFACWRLACQYPEQWAAIAPICGGGDPAALPHLKKVPVWCVHGSKDPDVPVQSSRELVTELQRLGFTHRYDELEGWGHNAWDWLYNPDRKQDSLVDWFLQFRKTAPPRPIAAPQRQGQFLDLLQDRVIVSVPAHSAIPHETSLLRHEAEQIAQFSFGDLSMRSGRLILKSDQELTSADLSQANHLMLGRTDNHRALKQVAPKLLARHLHGRLLVQNQPFLGKSLLAATSQPSPWNRKRLLGIITYQQCRQMRGIAQRLFTLHSNLLSVNLYDTQQHRFILQRP